MKRYVMTLILTAIIASPALAQEAKLQLTLKEAIKMAVEKNLDVQAELYNPAAAEADIRKNRGIYDPSLLLSTNYLDSTTLPPNLVTSGGVVNFQQQTFAYNMGINQLVPTGGTIGAAFNNTWNKNNSTSDLFLKKYWQSGLSFTLSQPLLKNFGRDATELNISVAVYNKEGSLERFKTRLLDTVARVRTEYNNLYNLRENLEVKKTALELARKVLSETQARVKAGVLPAMEILSAEFGVSSREKELIDAELAVKNQMDVVRLLLQLKGNEELIPVDIPSREYYQTDEAEEITRAIVYRPELQAQRANLKALELQARVARNRTRPDLALTAGVELTGEGKENGRTLERMGSGDFPVWTVGLAFSYPLGNRAAENDYIKSKLLVEQGLTQLKSQEESITTDVRNAVRGIASGYKQLDVTSRGSVYAEERLQAYIKKAQVGLATTKDVLDVQNDLVTAKGNEILAVALYNNAITQLWHVTGELLEREGIRVTEKEADSLYEKMK